MTDLVKRLRHAIRNPRRVTAVDRDKMMAEAAEALEWREIKYAPRDGTVVMLAHIVDGYVLWACAAEWGSAMPGYIQCASYSGWFHRLPATTDPARGPGEFAATGDIVARETCPPTHFMPVPSPPEDV